MGYELNNFTGLLMNFAWGTENQSIRGCFVNLIILLSILLSLVGCATPRSCLLIYKEPHEAMIVPVECLEAWKVCDQTNCLSFFDGRVNTWYYLIDRVPFIKSK
jgi:hypothetical protein